MKNVEIDIAKVAAIMDSTKSARALAKLSKPDPRIFIFRNLRSGLFCVKLMRSPNTVTAYLEISLREAIAAVAVFLAQEGEK